MAHDPDTWNTPPEVLDRVRKLGPIGLDPCSNPTSIVNAIREIRLPEDGLTAHWTGHGLVFCNPPYSRGNLTMWCLKIREEAKAGAEIVALVPSSTETVAFHKGIWHADAWCFPDHRIRFLVDGKVKGSGRKGHCIAYYGRRAGHFWAAFADYGRVILVA